MKVPAIFYGSHQTVQSHCLTVVDQLVNGIPWQQAIGSESTLDTAELTGYIILDGSDTGLDSLNSHFRFYVLLSEIEQALYSERMSYESEAAIFQSALGSAWGVLSLLAYRNISWFWRPQTRFTPAEWEAIRYRPMLTACQVFWNELYREGNRYTNGLMEGQDLWTINTSLKYVLANMGVPNSSLQPPLPAGDLMPLLTWALNRN